MGYYEGKLTKKMFKKYFIFNNIRNEKQFKEINEILENYEN
jgi:hypothetical protein